MFESLDDTNENELRESLDSEFNFEEMAEIEPAMVSLVEQMKENIETGKYDTLISDDAGGRVVTLVLRNIIKKQNPDKSCDTYFVSAEGAFRAPFKNSNLESEEDHDNYEKLLQHLRNIKSEAETKDALLVTQYVHSGRTITHLAEALEKAGIHKFDVAALSASWFENDPEDLKALGHSVYSGTRTGHKIDENHQKLSGVRQFKKGEYTPFPSTLEKAIEVQGREFSGAEIVSEEMRQLSEDEYIDKVHAPLQDKERGEIKENIRRAREDVALLAEKVIQQVWSEGSEK